jgi:hypothetical protein
LIGNKNPIRRHGVKRRRGRGVAGVHVSLRNQVVTVPSCAGNVTTIGGDIGHRIDIRSTTRPRRRRDRIRVNTPANEVGHTSKIYIALRDHVCSGRWGIDRDVTAIYIDSCGRGAIGNFLSEIANNVIHRALCQLIYARLIEAAVGDRTVAGRPREVSDRQAGQQHHKCQHDDERSSLLTTRGVFAQQRHVTTS